VNHNLLVFKINFLTDHNYTQLLKFHIFKIRDYFEATETGIDVDTEEAIIFVYVILILNII